MFQKCSPNRTRDYAVACYIRIRSTDKGDLNDSWIVTKSAMGSMSGRPEYKNTTAISDSTHLELPNDPRTITEIERFLNGYITL
jgi:hypothetical protein